MGLDRGIFSNIDAIPECQYNCALMFADRPTRAFPLRGSFILAPFLLGSDDIFVMWQKSYLLSKRIMA